MNEKKFDQNAYKAEFNKQNYDRIELKIPKGKKAEWQAKAKAVGMSLTEYIMKKVEGETDMYPYEPMPAPEVIHTETIRGAEYKIIKSYEMVPYGEVQDYTTGKVKKYGGSTPFYKILRNGEIFARCHSEEESMKHLDKVR